MPNLELKVKKILHAEPKNPYFDFQIHNKILNVLVYFFYNFHFYNSTLLEIYSKLILKTENSLSNVSLKKNIMIFRCSINFFLW